MHIHLPSFAFICSCTSYSVRNKYPAHVCIEADDQYLFSLITYVLCTCQYVCIMSILHMYYVHIITAQETRSHFPVTHTTIFETFKIRNFFPNVTAGLFSKCSVMIPNKEDQVRLRKGPSNGIDPDNCMKEPARKLPSNLPIIYKCRKSKIPRGVACLHTALC